MSFYQTSNANIVRFRTSPRKVVAPFAALGRVCQIENIGFGYSGYYTGTNTSFALTPEQLQNGSLIINPTNQATGGSYTLPSAYSLQEYLGGRQAFNISNGNLTTQQNTGANDFFLINVYNISTNTGTVVAYDNATSKVITRASVVNDAVLTPVLIQFSGVNSVYATAPGTSTANYVSYAVF
jgi:hypothetical protein